MNYDELDLHGCIKEEAKAKLDRKISSIVKPTELTIIHGFNGGRVLKDYVTRQYKNKRVHP